MTNIEQYSFYNRLYNYLLKIALNYTNDLDTAKEIVQLYRNIRKFKYTPWYGKITNV